VILVLMGVFGSGRSTVGSGFSPDRESMHCIQ
jgi:shikimate kinase